MGGVGKPAASDWKVPPDSVSKYSLAPVTVHIRAFASRFGSSVPFRVMTASGPGMGHPPCCWCILIPFAGDSDLPQQGL